MNYWFTSDTHFGHKNIIKYCDRPFNNAKEMDEALIDNWNSHVGENDIVWHLGDFALDSTRRIERLVQILNGQINLVYGNHDRNSKRACGFNWKGYYKEIYIDRQKIILFHYAMKVWNKSHHGSYLLYGHSHGTLSDDPNSLSMDVGIDCHDYRPIHFDEVKDIMDNKNYKPIDHHGR